MWAIVRDTESGEDEQSKQGEGERREEEGGEITDCNRQAADSIRKEGEGERGEREIRVRRASAASDQRPGSSSRHDGESQGKVSQAE